MIFTYSSIIKNKLNKNHNKDIYNFYYELGIKKISIIIKKFADTINENFIDDLLKHQDIHIVFYVNNSSFSIKNIIGIMIYTKTVNYNTKKEYIYILLICINKTCRKLGYGKIFLDEFIEYINTKSNDKNKYLILHPIDNSIDFYKSYGFVESKKLSHYYKKLFKYEKYDKHITLLELSLFKI